MIPIKKLMGYRGWKVWMSYDMHISLLTLLYILVVDNLSGPLDSLVLISSLGFYFMYGFLINDFFDSSYDIAVNKKRTIQELPKVTFIAIILGIIFISALHLLYLKKPIYIAVYITSYVLATFYSAPPVRFKNRAFLGIVVNALIEKTLPVIAVFAFFNHFEIDTLIFLTASFFIGLVEIVVHQIYDYTSDLETGVHTFVVNLGITKTLNIFFKYLSPFTGFLMLFLCLSIFIKIPSTTLIAALVFITYVVIYILKIKNKFGTEEKVLPLYISGLSFLILNALPPAIGFILTIKSQTNVILLLIAILSQYYIIKYRFKAIKTKTMPHSEIFIDTGKENEK